MRELGVAWLGRVAYPDAVRLQERLRERILAGEREAETLLLLEHEPVVTLGRRARAEHLLASEDELARRGIAVERSSRGGDVTYHGPGQLVAYPVVTLEHGVVAHVLAMARAVIEVAASFGVRTHFRRDCPGVWTESGAKLAAFGVHVHRRVAIHGVAFNVDLPCADRRGRGPHHGFGTSSPSFASLTGLGRAGAFDSALDPFSLIIPCGLRSAQVTSLAIEASRPIALADLVDPFADALTFALDRNRHAAVGCFLEARP
jgi:lipoyl(octanoyl) transferase